MIDAGRDAHSVARRRRRRRLLALPIVLALLAISIKLVTMSWFSTRGAAAYDDANYDRSVTEFDRLEVVNVIEPWRAYFGLGTSRHRQGDLEGAEAAFRRALELAPGRCDVRFNLVVTIEAQGDRLTGGATARGRGVQAPGRPRPLPRRPRHRRCRPVPDVDDGRRRHAARRGSRAPARQARRRELG